MYMVLQRHTNINSNMRTNKLYTDLQVPIYVHTANAIEYTRRKAHIGIYIHSYTCIWYIHEHMQMLKEILDNLPQTHFSMCTNSEAHANTNTCTRTHPAPPPSALSGTSLNIHHSGCSESAVNAASHSRESLKPTLSSALPPSFPSVTHTRTRIHF